MVIQKQIDAIEESPDYAYVKYHERMRKLGVPLPDEVDPPPPGEARMWPRDNTPTVRQAPQPPQVRDCTPYQEHYREWIKVPISAGFNSSGEAIYNWSWEPVKRVRRVVPFGC